MECPKCKAVRQPGNVECPHCGIIYEKFNNSVVESPSVSSGPLLEKRVGFNIRKTGFYSTSSMELTKYKMSWPMGKLELYSDHLRIGTIVKMLELQYSDIEHIKSAFLFFGLRIVHQSSDIPAAVYMSGFNLYGDIQKAIHKYRLKIKLL